MSDVERHYVDAQPGESTSVGPAATTGTTPPAIFFDFSWFHTLFSFVAAAPPESLPLPSNKRYSISNVRHVHGHAVAEVVEAPSKGWRLTVGSFVEHYTAARRKVPTWAVACGVLMLSLIHI